MEKFSQMNIARKIPLTLPLLQTCRALLNASGQQNLCRLKASPDQCPEAFFFLSSCRNGIEIELKLRQVLNYPCSEDIMCEEQRKCIILETKFTGT